MNIELSPQQQKLVSTAISILAGLVILLAAIILIFLIAGFFSRFSNVFLPLTVAAIAAMVIDPWYEWLKDRLNLSPAMAVIIVFITLLLPLTSVAIFFGAVLSSQLGDIVSELPARWQQFQEWLQEHQPRFEEFFKSTAVGTSITEAVKSPEGFLGKMGGFLMSGAVSAGSGVVSGVVLLMGWAVFPVYLAFFLVLPRLRPDALRRDHLPFLKEGTADDAIYLVHEFFNFVVVFFRGQILIALLQGLLFAVGFTLAGLEYGALLGLLLGFLNIVPYLGSMLGLSICLPLAWFQNDGGGLLLISLVLLVFVIVQLIEGYILTPKIMGDRTGLHPLVIIVAIFFWGSALNGLLGMILAIPLTAFLVVVWKLAQRKYIGAIF